MLRFERVGNVLEENQPKNDVLVFRRIHVVAKRICCSPKFGSKIEVRGAVLLR